MEPSQNQSMGGLLWLVLVGLLDVFSGISSFFRSLSGLGNIASRPGTVLKSTYEITPVSYPGNP